MKTVRRPPYPKWNPGYFPCSSLTPPSAFLTPSIGVLRWIRVKDPLPGLAHPPPAGEGPPARMDAQHPVGVLPDLVHLLYIEAAEGVVKAKVCRRHGADVRIVLGHLAPPGEWDDEIVPESPAPSHSVQRPHPRAFPARGGKTAARADHYDMLLFPRRHRQKKMLGGAGWLRRI